MKEHYFAHSRFFADVEGLLYLRGLRLNEFADVLKVSRTTIWRWKRGRAAMPVEAFLMFCNLLELEPADYFRLDLSATQLKNEINEKFPERKRND